MIVPWIVVGLPLAAVCERMMNSSVREVLHEEFIRTALSKGISHRRMLRKHAVPAAAAPVLTLAGVSVPVMVTNMVLVELTFSIPGVFQTFRSSMDNEDYPVIMGIVISAALLVALGSLMVDLALAWLDPKLRASAAPGGLGGHARAAAGGARRRPGRSAAARRRNANVQSGHSVELRPVASRYQLLQPVLQTVFAHPLVEPSLKSRTASGLDLDGAGAAPAHLLQRRGHVGHLGLDHVDHRAVPEAGVRAEQHEQVREAGDGRAEVGARAALPVLVERAAVAAADRAGRPACR